MIQSFEQRDPVEVLCEEFLDRWRNGESPTIEEYALANEALRDDIQTLFSAMLAMENAKDERDNDSRTRPVHLKIDRLEQLGDFRIIREIGRGGMAIVYEAEQQSLHRRVALKVFPDQAFENTRQLQRFEREAKTVAGLHHHNIVPVFGTGQQDGLHYFVMQLLDGITLAQVTRELAEYSTTRSVGFEPLRQIVSRWTSRGYHITREHQLNDTASFSVDGVQADVPDKPTSRSSPSVHDVPSDRPCPNFHRDRAYWQRVADIGRQVADALHYAHLNGIVHRDIKPSNLILDADWRVWVTDFGLAVETSQDPLSQTGDVVGTLLYMAPERLDGKADARSDIYSLGLTLYELLTYRTAFHGYSNADIRRQMLNGTPPTPRSLCRDIPADLETIVLKAMAREPHARYESAELLSRDLKNFCEDRPIQARRAGPIERLRRWGRRNPAIASMSAALLLCVTVSMTMVTVNWRRAAREGRRAESNLTLALQSMDRLLGRFEADWMEHPIAPDSEQVAGQIELRFVVSDRSAAVLQEALSFYEEFAEQNASNPMLQRDTANAYRRVGGIYERLGQLDKAETAYRNELQLQLSVDDLSADPDNLVKVAESQNRYAMVMSARYKHRAAQEQLRQVLSALSAYLAANPGSESVQYSLAVTNSNLGKVLWWLRAFKRSAQKHRTSIVLLEQLVDEHPNHALYRLSLARAYREYRLASFGRDRKHTSELWQAAAKLLEELVTDFPDVPDYRCELSEMLVNGAQFGYADPREKDSQAARALELSKSLAEEYAGIPRYKAAHARCLSIRANQIEHESLDDAKDLHNQAAAIYSNLCAQFPSVNDYLTFSAQALAAQADCHIKLGDTSAARNALQLAVLRQQEYLANRPESIFGRKWLSHYRTELSSLQVAEDNDEGGSRTKSSAEKK